MSKKIQVILLAGGQGSRLRPYTTVLPKPLMPLDDLPIAEVIIRQLKHYGLTNIAISTGHLAGLIEAYFGNGKKWGVNISYIFEDKPLGTAGAFKLVKNIEDDVLIINGDVLTDMNYLNLLKFHKSSKAAATITIKERSVKTDFGVIEFDKSDELVDYIEKPEVKHHVSIGVNVLNRKCKKYIEGGQIIGMPDLMLTLKDVKQKVKCYKTKDIWLDLGRFQDFEAAQELFAKNRKKFLLS